MICTAGQFNGFFCADVSKNGFSKPWILDEKRTQAIGVDQVLPASTVGSGAVTIPILLIGVPLLGLPVIQTAQPIADVLAGCISIPFILSFLKKNHNE